MNDRRVSMAIRLPVADGDVSACLLRPDAARLCFVFAHGAGAGMDHPFMTEMAEALCERGVATLRYNFSYMERGTRRPDAPARAHAAIRAAVREACLRCPDLPLVAGGKSFGGRMTSMLQADTPLDAVEGLVFLGFPLHPAGRPGSERALHLQDVRAPTLFLQGTRDKLAEQALMQTAVSQMERARLVWFDDADHSFHVPARSGRTDDAVRHALADAVSQWCADVIGV